MAEALRFICNHCFHAIESWSDGNPYFIQEEGQKQYAYHPDHENLARCIGNDSPYICLRCGEEFMVDSLSPIEECPACSSTNMSDTFQLNGKSCPFCHKGTFNVDPDYYIIS